MLFLGIIHGRILHVSMPGGLFFRSRGFIFKWGVDGDGHLFWWWGGRFRKKSLDGGTPPMPPHYGKPCPRDSFFCISTFQNLGLKVVPPSRNGGTDTMIIRRDFQKCTVWSLVFVCFFMITNQKISSNFIISCKFASLFLLFILSVHQIIHLFLNKQSIFDPHLKNCLSFPKRWPPKIV